MAPDLLPMAGYMQPEKPMAKPDERLLPYLLAFGILVALICLGYFEENWRGKRAWASLKHQLEARGAAIDWTNFIPATVPAGQNFFEASKMQRWFVGRGGNDLTARLNGARSTFLAEHTGDAVASVTVVLSGEQITSTNTDIILQYNSGLAALALQPEGASLVAPPQPQIIPLIVMDAVPLPDAIKNLARQAGINYAIFSKNGFDPRGQQPLVSDRWTNLTAEQVLNDLFWKYHLRFQPNSKTGIGSIIIRGPGDPNICLDPAAEQRLKKCMFETIDAVTNDFKGPSSLSACDLALVGERQAPFKPLKILVLADKLPTTNEVADFFPALVSPRLSWITSHAQVAASGSNTLQVRLSPAPFVPAADYLTWSDGFAADFDLIRGALQRPCAQMNGDYSTPDTLPIPNFVCLRLMAQTLSDRAKCHLLLNHPEAALRDLTLMHDMCRLMESPPNTLVATMINTAITGLYTETIAEGIRLQAWREPELVALQKQLAQVNLLPLLAKSLILERACLCRMLETVKAGEFEKMFYISPTTNFWQKMKDPAFLTFQIGPRGWVYQNMIKIATVHQSLLDAFDLTNRVVASSKSERANSHMQATLHRFSPYTFMANMMVPNFIRAVQILARNQNQADEALVACALERYRLTHHQYPPKLDSLVPEFLDTIPTDIINGQALKYRLEGSRFILYSVGWNEKDDGGVTGPRKNGDVDATQGDWVWAALNR